MAESEDHTEAMRNGLGFSFLPEERMEEPEVHREKELCIV